MPARLVYVSLLAVYSALRVMNLQAIAEVRVFPDTPVYAAIASRSFLDPRFWIGERPWTTPLCHKLLGNDPAAIALAQMAVSIVCWTLLAFAVARAVRLPWLKPVAFGAILLFSSSAEITLWDGVILADSLSLSLLAAVVASGLWLLESWTWPRVGAVGLSALLWAFTKDTNAWTVLAIAALLLVGVAARRLPWRYTLVAGILLVVFGLNDAAASKAPRWVVAFMNTVGLRILPSPENTAYFEAQGMPVSPALMRRTNKKAWRDDWAFFRDPELQPFRDWLYARGKRTYVRFLLTHPASTIQDPLRHTEALLSSTALRNYAPASFSGILPEPLAELVYFKRWAVAWIWVAAVAIGLLLGSKPWTRNAAFLVPLALLLLVYPQIVIAWHGDPNEIERHGLEAAVTLRLGLWLSLLLGADSLLDRWRSASRRLASAGARRL